MSGFGNEAEILGSTEHCRFWPEADLAVDRQWVISWSSGSARCWASVPPDEITNDRLIVSLL